AVVRVVPVQGLARQRSGPAEHRGQADAVRFAAALDATRLEKRRVEINTADRHIATLTGFRDAGPLDEKRHADTAFVEVAFAISQRRVDRRRRVRPLADAQAAVVRGEDDDRLIAQLQVIQLLENAADALVHALDHGGVDRIVLAARFAVAAVLGLQILL